MKVRAYETREAHEFVYSTLRDPWANHYSRAIPSCNLFTPTCGTTGLQRVSGCLVAFAPVDDENTLMYLRYYHKVKTPVLRQITGFFGKLGNFVIERQDRPVVITQRPYRADLDIGEKLIPGDGSIITYRKIRRELIEAGETKK